jgi:hypothetical protein
MFASQAYGTPQVLHSPTCSCLAAPLGSSTVPCGSASAGGLLTSHGYMYVYGMPQAAPPPPLPELARFRVDETGPTNGLLLATLIRTAPPTATPVGEVEQKQWAYRAEGVPLEGRTASDEALQKRVLASLGAEGGAEKQIQRPIHQRPRASAAAPTPASLSERLAAAAAGSPGGGDR